MGKYDRVIGSLKKLPAADAKYDERIAATKDCIIKRDELEVLAVNGMAWKLDGEATDPMKLDHMVAAFVALRKTKDALESSLSTANEHIEALTQLIVAEMEATGVQSIKLKDGTSVTHQPEPHSQITDQDALLAWAKARGIEPKVNIPWQTVNAIAKECLLAGESYPDGVEVFVRDKLVLRGAK